MDNKDNEQKDSTIEKGKQNIINAAGKKAASTFGGPLGGKAYDALSKTELGQKAINNVSEQLTNTKNMPGMGLPGMPGGLPKPSGLQNENDGLKEKQEQENKKENSPFSSNDNNDSDGENNFKTSENAGIIQKWKSLPQPIKTLVLIGVPFMLVCFILILIPPIIQILTASNSETLYEDMASNSSTDEFYGDAGNFIVTAEGTKASKAEKAYYEKLQDVYEEFQEKYGVSIDTTLITATLFYGRTVEDYGNEDDVGNIEENNSNDNSANDNLFYESDETDDDVKFYKLAKRHIKTLAKYMLIQNTTFNACVPDSEVDYLITPTTSKQIADNWTTISTWKFKDHSSWNSLNAFNYTKYNEKTYTNANGQEKTITWCNYDDADTQLRAGYEEDRKIYHSKKDAYHSCINSHRNACINSCALMDEDCRKRCDKTVYDIDCSTEKSQMDEAYGYYYNNWLSQGLYDDGGNFTCKTTEKWGHLETWDDTSRFMNHKFDIDLKNKANIPNFLETYDYYISNEKIDCSAEPSIKYIYSTDTSEEGVYYYKLLTKTSAGFFSSKKSFIERYYPELIDNSSEEMRYKSAKNIVDGIFLLYDTVVDRDTRYCITPSDNGGAGVSGSGTTPVSSSRTAFIESIANDVIIDMQNSGIFASVTLAQAALESGNGGSGLASNYNNYYGMTAGNCAPARLSTTKSTLVKAGTGENRCSGNAFWNGDVVWMCNSKGKDCQWYRVYDSFSNSTHDHSRLLSTSRYNCQGIGNPVDQLNCIKSGGYATDPDYVNKLINVINTYNLTQYDIGEWSGEILSEYGSSALGTICYDTTFEKEIANGEGTINGMLNGQRTQLYGTPEYNTFWLSNNNLFYASNPNLVEQCTWYANGRALEILTSNGMDLVTAKKNLFPMHGNAGLWYSQNRYFSSSTSVNNPKVGAIIVWKNPGKPGHVAIVEDVQYDSSGNAVSVSLSEGGKSINGFRYVQTRSIDYIRKHGTYSFVGYVYLLG